MSPGLIPPIVALGLSIACLIVVAYEILRAEKAKRLFDAYVRWLERWAWFRWVAARLERFDDHGRASGWW